MNSDFYCTVLWINLAKCEYIQFHCILHHISIPEFYRGSYKKKNALIICLPAQKKMSLHYNITFFYKHKIFHFWIFFLYLYYFLSCGTWFQDSEWEKKSFYLIKLPKWKNVRNPRLSAWPKKLEVGHLLSPTQSINPKNPGLICLTGNKLFIKLYHWLGCST